MGTLAGLFEACPTTECLVDGYTLEADDNGFYGNMRFYFESSDMVAFSQYVAGNQQTLTIQSTAGGVSVTRLIPLQHPRIANCYCDKIKIYTPDDMAATYDPEFGIDFPFYFSDVHFSTPQYSYETGDYPTVQISLDAGREMVTRPGTAYKMLSDGLRVNHDVGVPVQKIDFTLTMNRLTQLDFDLYASLAGNWNLTQFFGQDMGKVLYVGPTVTGQQTIGGLPSYNASHRFQFRSVPHYMIMRPDGGPGPNGDGFDTPVLQDGSTKMLPGAELNQLWGM